MQKIRYILMLLLITMLTSCGSSSSSNSSTDSITSITIANNEIISFGMTIEDVEAILGDGEKIEFPPNSISYDDGLEIAYRDGLICSICIIDGKNIKTYKEITFRTSKKNLLKSYNDEIKDSANGYDVFFKDQAEIEKDAQGAYKSLGHSEFDFVISYSFKDDLIDRIWIADSKYAVMLH